MPRKRGRLSWGAAPPQKCCGVESGGLLFARQDAFHVNVEGGRLALGEKVESAGNGARYTGTHEDVIHLGEHGAVEGGERGELDLFKIVDANRSLMAFFGQKNFDEVGDDRQLDQLTAGPERRHGRQGKRNAGGLAAGNEVICEHAGGHAWERESGQGMAQLTAGVTELKAPGQDDGEGGSGNDAQAGPGPKQRGPAANRRRQPPCRPE